MAGRLQGKVALITGTSRGIGREAALLFAREGAAVVGCARSATALEKTHAQIEAEGGKTAYRVADLSDEDAVRDLVAWVAKRFGRIDILYNNAASARIGSVLEMSAEDWHYTLRNELDVVFYTVKHVAPVMRDSGGGAIINTASVVALSGTSFGGWLQWTAHSAAAGGILAMTRTLAQELAPYTIRVNSMTLGGVENDAWSAFGKEFVEQHKSRILPLQLIKRTGTNLDAAYCALYLASDEASFVTGQNFVVDGGLTAV